MKTNQSASQSTENSVEQLVILYKPLVWAVVIKTVKNRMDTEEVVHDVLLKAIARLESFDSEKGTLKTWLMAIAHNASIDFVRKKSTQMWTKSTDEIPERFTKMSEPDERLGLCANLLKNLSKVLNEQEAYILRLDLVENKKHSEIAQELAMDVKYVAVVKYRAIAKLRKYTNQK